MPDRTIYLDHQNDRCAGNVNVNAHGGHADPICVHITHYAVSGVSTTVGLRLSVAQARTIAALIERACDDHDAKTLPPNARRIDDQRSNVDLAALAATVAGFNPDAIEDARR